MNKKLDSQQPETPAAEKDLVGISSTDLLAFSSILGGLLASGHYTEKVEVDNAGIVSSGLLTDDLGKKWRYDFKDDPRIRRRYMPVAIFTAQTLWLDMKKTIQFHK